MAEPGLLFTGGTIHTMVGPPLGPDSALLTRGGRIRFVGPRSELPSTADLELTEVDLAGRPLLPGLCDGHLHLVLAAELWAGLDCGRAPDLEALLELVRQEARDLPEDGWITGAGLEWQRLFAGGTPQRSDLDRVGGGRPVYLLGRDLHSAWLSTAALRRVRSLPTRPPGCVVPAGGEEPSGLVHESVIDLRDRLLPPPGAGEQLARLPSLVERLHRSGITVVHTNESPEAHALVSRYLGTTAPRVRVLWNLYVESPDQLREHAHLLRQHLPGWLAPGGVKLFLDGTLGSRTAALSRPYRGTTSQGLLNLSDGELEEWLRAVHALGSHAVFHVIGDRAAAQALRGLDRLRWPAGTHHRLEHAQLLPPEVVAAAAFRELILSVQPSHLWGDLELLEAHVPEKLTTGHAYAYRTMWEKAHTLILGSDAPVEDPWPWKGIQAAVTRTGGDGRPPWRPEEALTLSQALAGHTVNPALLHGPHFPCGSLRPGHLADLVVLRADPFQAAAGSGEAWRELQADLTCVDGEVVYCRS